MQLHSRYELIGDVVEIIDELGYTKVVFSVRTELELPEDAIPIKFLRKLIGKHIGILNIDGEYHVRIINKKIKENKQKKNLTRGNGVKTNDQQ